MQPGVHFGYSTNLMPWLLELVDFPTRNAAAIASTLGRLQQLLETHP